MFDKNLTRGLCHLLDRSTALIVADCTLLVLRTKVYERCDSLAKEGLQQLYSNFRLRYKTIWIVVLRPQHCIAQEKNISCPDWTWIFYPTRQTRDLALLSLLGFFVHDAQTLMS